MSYLSYADINKLEEINFIAGSEYTIEYKVYEQSGAEANLGAATCSAKISQYGSTDELVSYSGTITGSNTFEIVILSADSIGWEGKYLHQPIIVESGKSYRSQQGVINVSGAIQ
ncbi:MAG: hypothetical protein PHU53_06340 [Thermoplasmata archaeon]|nr:hypothetical protein [Thermoplasmata archaeon]